MKHTTHAQLLFFGLLSAMLLNVELPAAARNDHRLVLVSATPKALNDAALRQAENRATPPHASADHKSLTFHGKQVSIVAHTGPDNDMLSYRIAGLRNPTLVVPSGSVLRVLFVNTDGDMKHDLLVSTLAPPFAAEPHALGSVGTPPLNHRNGKLLYAEVVVIRAQPGNYRYFCSVKGHAKGGMFGTLVVR